MIESPPNVYASGAPLELVPDCVRVAVLGVVVVKVSRLPNWLSAVLRHQEAGNWRCSNRPVSTDKSLALKEPGPRQSDHRPCLPCPVGIGQEQLRLCHRGIADVDAWRGATCVRSIERNFRPIWGECWVLITLNPLGVNPGEKPPLSLSNMTEKVLLPLAVY